MEKIQSKNPSDVSKGVVDFTSDLCKIFHKNIQESYVCSSLSAHTALSMAAYGADGNTAIEMRKVLHLSNDDSKLLEDYQQLIGILNTDENAENNETLKEMSENRIKRYSEDENFSEEDKRMYIQCERELFMEDELRNKKIQCIATLANRIYISNKRKVQEHYNNALSMYFGSKSETLDFEKHEEAARIINDWCTEATNGKISDVVDPDTLSTDTALILINAVYFTGKWDHEFTAAIPKTFHLNMLKKIKVPTMYIKRKLDYRNLRGLNAKAVRLDFMRCDKYMEIIVPNSINGLKVIEKNLNKISKKEFKYTHVCLWLPKFEVQTETKLEEYLEMMGMKEAFDDKLANFNKICDKEIFIKTVLQKAYIKVDELGCEAAAVTKVQMGTKKSLFICKRKPRYITIKANRPFLFRIMDSRLDIPLFIGKIVNPNKVTSKGTENGN